MAKRMSRGPRFVLEIVPGGVGAAHGRQRVGVAATQAAIFKRFCEVIQQWAAAEGAVAPGTSVSVIDTEVGQVIFGATYAGYAPQPSMGGMRTWDALSKPTTAQSTLF